MDTPTRAAAARAALADAWGRKPGRDLRQTRGDLTLAITERPDWVLNGKGARVGVDFRVRLFHGREEVPVDGHRRFVRPPLYVDDGPPDAVLGIEQLFPELWPRKRRLDPVAALWDALWASVLRTPAQENWGDLRGTVTEVFADTADGFVSSTNATYSTARSGSGLSANTTADLRVGQSRPKDYLVEQGFLTFDTSAIDDGDTIDSVTLALWLTTDSSSADFVTEAREYDWGGSLTTTDFRAGTALAALTLLASINSSGIGATGAYKSFTSEAAFLTATGLKTGMVNVHLSSAEQRLNSAPAGNEFLVWESANTAGTSNDPKLTIVHSASGITGTAAVVAPMPTAAATGTVRVSGTGASVSPVPTSAAGGTIRVSGAGAGSAAAASVAGSGAPRVSGTGSAVAPAPVASGEGRVPIAGTGSATAPAATAASSGVVRASGTGTAAAPGAEASGAGTVRVAGTGAAASPPAVVAGTGPVESVTGTGAAAAPASEVAAAATIRISGTGAAIAAGVGAFGAGLIRLPGTGAGRAPAGIASAAGGVRTSGTGAVAAPAAFAGGSGSMVGLVLPGAVAGAFAALYAAEGQFAAAMTRGEFAALHRVEGAFTAAEAEGSFEALATAAGRFGGG